MDMPRGAAGSNVGLNILASPTRGSNEDDEFISPAHLADTQNANDWDLSMFNSRASNVNVTRVASRWDRESLYQHFDPCARERPTTAANVRTGPPSSSFRSTSELIEETSLRDDFFLSDHQDSNLGLSNTESEDVFSTPPVNKTNGLLVELASPPDEVDEDWNNVCNNESPPTQMHRSSGLIRNDNEGSSPNDLFTTASDIVMVDNEEDVIVVVNEDQAEVDDTRSTQLDEALLRIEDYKAVILTADQDKLVMEAQLEQVTGGFRNMQMAFNEVNRRYERVQALLSNSRKNEDLLMARDAEMVEKLASVNEHLEEVKSSVKTKLDLMYQNYESKFQSLNSETGKLRAQLRMAEMRNEGLENEVQQKTSEVKKLSLLCDDLIRQNVKQ